MFSLVARRLGAEVHSFDYDPESVACTAELKHRYYPNDPNWTVEEGSVLEDSYMSSLGKFDVVYSWGVLHHTGSMWEALENAVSRVEDNGFLFIAIYNDQGRISKLWKNIKKLYCSSIIGRAIVFLTIIPYLSFLDMLRSVIKRENVFSEYKVVYK